MKKRWALILLALVLTVTAVLPAGAAGSVYFTSINDKLLELSDGTMPSWSGNYLYVPYTVFSDGTLKVYCSVLQGQGKSATVFTREKSLKFDLEQGNCTDQDGNTYAWKAIQRNGKVYFPIASVCNFFGLSYSYLQSDYGVLVRIKSGDVVLSDEEFLDAASGPMKSRLDQYNKSKEPVEDPGPGTDPAGPQDPEDPEEKDSPDVYLAFDGCPSAGTEELLDLLHDYGRKASFFFRPEEVLDSAALINRMIAEGHTVGLSGNAELEPGLLMAELEEGNRAMEAIGCFRTRIVCVPGASDQLKQSLAAQGYACWTWWTNGDYAGQSAATAARNLLASIQKRDNQDHVRLADGEGAPEVLRRLLTEFVRNENQMYPIRETTRS